MTGDILRRELEEVERRHQQREQQLEVKLAEQLGMLKALALNAAPQPAAAQPAPLQIAGSRRISGDYRDDRRYGPEYPDDRSQMGARYGASSRRRRRYSGYDPRYS